LFPSTTTEINIGSGVWACGGYFAFPRREQGRPQKACGFIQFTPQFGADCGFWETARGTEMR
jgi:hypothetical protein